MTGLDPNKDTILSVACFVTNAFLDPLDHHGFEAFIHHDSHALANMNQWCIDTHTASGLVDQCVNSTTTAEDAASDLLAYIKSHVSDKGTALLAGNSVHADKMFLMQSPWNQVLDWLHYRILDISAIKEGVRRWCQNDVLQGVPRKALKHTATEDILESIEEARYYQKLFAQMSKPSVPGILDPRPSQNDARPLPSESDGYGNLIPTSTKRQNSGIKRTATVAGLHSPTNGNAGLAPSFPDKDVAVDPRQSDDAGFRTDVP